MKVLLVAAGVFIGVTTTAYWLLGQAIATMDEWVNEPDPGDEGEDFWDEDEFDDPEYD